VRVCKRDRQSKSLIGHLVGSCVCVCVCVRESVCLFVFERNNPKILSAVLRRLVCARVWACLCPCVCVLCVCDCEWRMSTRS